MIDFAPHNMTSNNLPCPYVASASSEAPPDLAFRCFDGTETAGFSWRTDWETTGFLKIYLGPTQLYTLYEYQITFSADQNTTYAPKDWTLEGSHNGVDWDVLDAVAGEVGWSQGEKRTFVCDVKTTPYLFYKINISANNGGVRISMAQIYLWGSYVNQFSGTVKEKGNPVIRTIRSYIRSTGVLFATATSKADGTFSVVALDTTTEMFVVAFDDDAGDQYNALIFDRVKGVPI